MKKITVLVNPNPVVDNTLAINSFVIMFARLVGPGGSFFFWALAARMTNDDDLGLASATIAAVALLSGLAQLGIGFGLVRYLPHSNDSVHLTNLALEAVGVTSTILAVIFVLGVEIWSPALKVIRDDLIVASGFIILVLFYSLSLLLNSVYLARDVPIFSALSLGLQTILSILLFIAFVNQFEGFLAVIFAYLLSIVASFLLAVLFFLPQSEPGFKFRFVGLRGLRSSFGHYAFGNYMSQQIVQAPGNLMTLISVNILGPSVSGFFFVAWTISQGLLALAGSVSDSLFAEGSKLPDYIASLTRDALKLGLPIAIGLSLLLIVFGEYVLVIFGQEFVLNSLVPLQILGLSIIPGVILTIFFSILRIQANLRLLIFISIIWVLSSLITTVTLMSTLGINGAALGWMLSQFVITLLFFIVWKKRLIPKAIQS